MMLHSDVLPNVVEMALSDVDGQQLLNLSVQVRVMSAAALLFSCTRIIRREPGIALVPLLDEALPFVVRTLQMLSRDAGKRQLREIAQAQHAMMHHVALGKNVENILDLGFPPGYDGRNCPEQMVVFAVALASQPPQQIIPSISGVGDVISSVVIQLAKLRYGIPFNLQTHSEQQYVECVQPEQLVLSI